MQLAMLPGYITGVYLTVYELLFRQTEKLTYKERSDKIRLG